MRELWTRLESSETFWKWVLVGAAFTWGASYLVTQHVAQLLSPYWVVVLRFIPATLLCAVVLRRRLFLPENRAARRFGLRLGVFSFAGYALQTWGIVWTTPGRNAFLTGIYCILVPFVCWAMGMGRPERRNVVAAGLAVAGLACISLDGGSFALNRGDVLSLACAFAWAVAIGMTARDGAGLDMWVATTFNFAVTGVFALVGALIAESAPVAITRPDVLCGIVFLSLVCTLIDTLGFNIAMTKVDPSEGSLLASLEAPSGAAVSVMAGAERVSGRLFVGFALMTCAVILSQAGQLVLDWGHARLAGRTRRLWVQLSAIAF